MRKIIGSTLLRLLVFGCFLLISCGKYVSSFTPTQEIHISKKTEPSPDAKVTTSPYLLATTETTTQIETTVTIIPDDNLFVSQYCPISLRRNPDWTINEIKAGEPGSRSMEGSTIELIKEQYCLAIICFYQSGDSEISPGGRGAGDIISLPDIQIIDQAIPGQGTSWEGDLISVLYLYRIDNLSIFADIGSNPYPSNPKPDEKFVISQDLVTEVGQILESISLTEPISLIKSTPSSYDLQVILPMEDYYYSQLEDIDLPNACAPTAGFIVLDYLRKETTLVEVAEILMLTDPEYGGYDPACERNIICTSPMTLAQRLSSEYYLTISTRQGWTLESVQEALLKGHPIIADILWRLDGRSLGHFVVIFGVDIANELIYYHDPIEGKSQISSWQDFSARWAGPVDVGDPTYLQGFQYWGMEVYSEDWEDELSK